jgi:hypothetical protein
LFISHDLDIDGVDITILNLLFLPLHHVHHGILFFFLLTRTQTRFWSERECMCV